MFIKSGKKKTGEKILLKFVKAFQKLNNKKFISLFQLAIINVTSIFSLKTQVVKKGKRKVTKDVPSFFSDHSFRVSNSLNLLKRSVVKDKKTAYFYEMLVKEVLNSSSLNSSSVLIHNEVQNKILLNKRYWSNFRW